MSPTPVTRSELRQLHLKKMEAAVSAHIQQVVERIYTQTLYTASGSSNETHYKFLIPGNDPKSYTEKILSEILLKLRNLFPDCDVRLTPMGVKGQYILVDWK